MLGQAISLLVAIIITRSMGLDAKGQISLFLTLPAVLMVFAMLGGAQACVYHLGKGNLSLNELIPVTWVLAVVQSLVTIALFIPVWLLLRDNLLRGMDPLYVLCIVALLPAAMLFEYTINLMRGVQRPLLYNLYRVIRNILYLVLILLVWLVGRATVGATLVAWGVSLIVALVLAQRSLLTLRPSRGRWSLSRSAFAQIIRYGVEVSPTLVLAWLGYRFDIYIVNSLANKTSVGAYSIAVSIAELAWFVPTAVSIVIFPMIARMTEAEANTFTPLVLRQTLAVMVVACLALLLMGPRIITVAFGPQARLAVMPLYLLLPGIFIFSGLKVIWQDQCGRGFPLDAVVPMLTNVLVDIGLAFLLIPRLGINGAALASSISYSSAGILTIIIFTRRTGLTLSGLLRPTENDRHLYAGLFQRVAFTSRKLISSVGVGRAG